MLNYAKSMSGYFNLRQVVWMRAVEQAVEKSVRQSTTKALYFHWMKMPQCYWYPYGCFINRHTTQTQLIQHS